MRCWLIRHRMACAAPCSAGGLVVGITSAYCGMIWAQSIAAQTDGPAPRLYSMSPASVRATRARALLDWDRPPASGLDGARTCKAAIASGTNRRRVQAGTLAAVLKEPKMLGLKMKAICMSPTIAAAVRAVIHKYS